MPPTACGVNDYVEYILTQRKCLKLLSKNCDFQFSFFAAEPASSCFSLYKWERFNKKREAAEIGDLSLERPQKKQREWKFLRNWRCCYRDYGEIWRLR